MARVKLVDPSQASGELKEIFDEIEKATGTISNVWRAYANKPGLLRKTWERRAAIMGRGDLRGQIKEGIALAVSEANKCQYCINAHSKALANFKASPQRIEALRFRTVEDPAERALLDYAVAVSTDPHSITDGDIQRLKALGYSDVALVEATAVAAYYAGTNRFIDALGIDPD